MKKLSLLSIFLIFLLLLGTFGLTANAAEVDLYSSSAEEEESTEVTEDDSLPSYYSSMDEGWCTTVKIQNGQLCWAFASMSSFETLLLKSGLYRSPLSTSALDLWSVPDENGDGWQRGEADSGYTYISMGYFISRSGPVTETGSETGLYVNAIEYLKKGDSDRIKQLIMENGAVTANMNIYSNAYSADRCSYCLTDEISHMNGHCISVIGWDDDYPREKFGNYMPKNNGAWLCKNSYGDSFNEIGGYLWVSYEDYYLFSVNPLSPSYAITQTEKASAQSKLYQNEIYGATYSFKYIEDDVVVYFNAFDFEKDSNVLDKIIFETACEGAEYRLYYVPVVDGMPDGNRLSWKRLGAGTVERGGYICCDIDDKTVAAKRGAIAVELDLTAVNADKPEGEKVRNSIGVSEWLRNRTTRKMIFVDHVQSGNSFVTFNGIKNLFKSIRGMRIIHDNTKWLAFIYDIHTAFD